MSLVWKRRWKPHIALFLVICMAVSMFTGIPVNAEEPDGEETPAIGLVAADWESIDWNWNEELEKDVPSLKDEVKLIKETWATWDAVTLYLAYRETEEAELSIVSADDISIRCGDENATAAQVIYQANEENSDFIEFRFYEVGEYTVTYKNGENNSIKIYVEEPQIGFYAAEDAGSANFLSSFTYSAPEENTFYMVLRPGDGNTLALDSEAPFMVEDYETQSEIRDKEAIAEYITCQKVAGKENTYKITVNTKKGFALWVYGTATPSEGDSWSENRCISVNYREKMEGLLVYGEDEESGEYWYDKEGWGELPGASLCLGYRETEDGELTKVAAEDISIQYNGAGGSENLPTCSDNPYAADRIDFQCHQAGDYTVTYNKGTAGKNSITIHVDFPAVGFYETNQMTVEGLIQEIQYERNTGKTFYIIPNPSEDWTNFTYKVMTEETYDDGVYITVNGTPLNPNEAITGTAEVSITADAKCSFGLKAAGTFTNGDGNQENREQYLWCNDPYEGAPVIEDGEEHKGFAGCFITKRAYENSVFWDEGSSEAQYWVHAETLQGVIDKLLEAAKKGSVTIGEGEETETYPVHNTGYIWTNASYFPWYENEAMQPQYVTTPSDVKGIIMSSGLEVYYVNETNSTGSYYPVQLWEKDTDEIYTCEKDDGKFYSVTGDVENGFTLSDSDTEGKEKSALEAEGYTLSEEFGIYCQWPELHVDATTNVKIIGDFAEVEEDGPQVYLGLYEDSEIVSQISDGWNDEKDGYDFTSITSDNIDSVITTKKGTKVKVVKLVTQTGTSVRGDFVSAGDVAIEDATGGKELRDKLGMEELIADDEELKQAIISGEPLKVSLDMDTLKENGESQPEAVNTGIAKIAELVKQVKNEVSKIQYLDIGLKYQVGKKQGDITETKEDISINVTLPAEFTKPNKEAAKSYEIVVYRYHDGKAEKLDSTFDNGKLTFKTGKFSVYAIAVEEVVPTGIQIKAAPAKTAYTAGESFDKTGMIVELVYSDGTTKVITDYTVSTAALTEADKEITVVYGAFTAKQAITVKASQTPTPPEPPTPPAPPVEEPIEVGSAVTVNGNNYKVTSVADNKKAVTFVSGDKKAAKITVPATVKIDGSTYQVTAIADNAFAGSSKLTTVTLPAGITKIGKNAFKSCTKLKSITIPKNVTEIGTNAFYNCKKLTSVKFKGTKIKKIGQGAFAKCSSLKSITIPKSVTEIGKEAFKDCKKLSKVTIKGTVLKKIGKNAFKNIAKKAVIKVPKKKKTAYKKLLKNAGYKGTVK